MLESKYIQGASLLPIDDEITEGIESYSIEGGGKPMTTAIENLDGNVYRVITSVGMGSYIYVTSMLSELGLEDLLVNSPYGEGGLDSRFKVPLQLRKELLSKRLVRNNIINDIQEAEESLKALEETERESIIQSRIGQGLFRKRLIEYWGGCAVTECKFPALLRASHIKPWRLANNAERLDVFNGLLLSPNIDAAFDAGYISFEPSGRILMSDVFKGNPAYELRISPKARLNQKLLSEKHEEYLEFHRTNVFING